MRVLHVIKGLAAGGAERLLVSMAGARAPDVQFEVGYLMADQTDLVAELLDTGSRVHMLGGDRGMADPRWPFRLLRLVRDRRPDVVHLHSPAVAAIARPILRSLRHRPLLVSTEHNQWGSFHPLTRMANEITLPLTDLHLAVSNEVRASMPPRDQRRTEVLVHGIPVNEVVSRGGDRAEARQRLGAGPDDVVVTIIANFREKKDYPTLLAAAAKATRVEPRLRFYSVGKGPLEGELKRRHAELGLGSSFEFLGYQSNPAHILAGSDLFTLTSRHEGLSIALLEALALGVPAVVSAVGGMQSVMSGLDGALLLPAGDAERFADAYVALARDPERRAVMAKCAAIHAQNFDIQKTQRWLEDRYTEALDHR